MCPADIFALHILNTSAHSPGCSLKTKENIIFKVLGEGYKIHIGCPRGKTTFGNFKTLDGCCSLVSCLSLCPASPLCPPLPRVLLSPVSSSLPCPASPLPLSYVLPLPIFHSLHHYHPTSSDNFLSSIWKFTSCPGWVCSASSSPHPAWKKTQVCFAEQWRGGSYTSGFSFGVWLTC